MQPSDQVANSAKPPPSASPNTACITSATAQASRGFGVSRAITPLPSAGMKNSQGTTTLPRPKTSPSRSGSPRRPPQGILKNKDGKGEKGEAPP